MNRLIFVALSASIGTAMAAVACRTPQTASSQPVGRVIPELPEGEGGEISGNVFDQNGAPLKGVKVVVSLSNEPTATRKKYTNDEGYFKVSHLPTGTYDVSGVSPGLETYTQRNVAVRVRGRVELCLIMEIKTAEVEYSLVEKAPIVSTRSASKTERGGIITFRSVAALEVSSGGYGAENAKSKLNGESLDHLPLENAPQIAMPGLPEFDTERYGAVTHNEFMSAAENPLSTFSIDVDTASYANVRRFIDTGRLPPPGAVRVEEMVNYFKYSYPAPRSGELFATSMEIGSCPWNPEARLVRIALRGMEVPPGKRVPSNLVFLIDVSGSMEEPDKLPLVQESLRHLVSQLNPEDRVAIVVYAGAAGEVLPSTAARRRQDILRAIGNLSAGGSTNGGQGIALAYDIAKKNFIANGNNRVFLATDGDFNVGVTSESELVSLVEARAKEGVFLSVLGFGTGNLNDGMMEQLADRGDGNHSYIDTIDEARRVLGANLTGTMLTIAKDVKLQVEWNPARVGAYRLVGYENRMLAKEDFNDDRKDAGDLGSGHTVTALYEVLPPGAAAQTAVADRKVDDLKYSQPAGGNYDGGDLLTLKVRYKAPRGGASDRRDWTLVDAPAQDGGSTDLRFATSVALFGMLMRGTPTRAPVSYQTALALAESAANNDPERQSLVELIRTAGKLTRR